MNENEILNFTLPVKEYKEWLESLTKKIEGLPNDKLITVSFQEEEDGIATKVFEVPLAIYPEVYSRIVGYIRPVENWNKAKKTEFPMRHTQKKEDIENTINHNDK